MVGVNRRALEQLGASVVLDRLVAEKRALERFLAVTSGRIAVTPHRRARRRSHMSAAARRAVSIRMRRYWAERRRSKAS